MWEGWFEKGGVPDARLIPHLHFVFGGCAQQCGSKAVIYPGVLGPRNLCVFLEVYESFYWMAVRSLPE